jgi:glycine cleavage system H protein
VKADEPCAVVESVKAASDVYAPLAGEITAGNTALAEAPETVNSQPYAAGWLMRIKPAPGALAAAALLSAADYQKLLDAEGG